MDPMEYLEQAKANAQAMQAAAAMQENTASIAASLRARMEQLDAMAAGPVTSVGSSLSAEDRYRFGLDSTQKASPGGARAMGSSLQRDSRASASQRVPTQRQTLPQSSGGANHKGMDAATSELIKKLEACGEYENAKKLRASFSM
jgi:hypothetical protein